MKLKEIILSMIYGKKCPKCGNKLILKERINMTDTVKFKYCIRCGWSKEIH